MDPHTVLGLIRGSFTEFVNHLTVLILKFVPSWFILPTKAYRAYTGPSSQVPKAWSFLPNLRCLFLPDTQSLNRYSGREK